MNVSSSTAKLLYSDVKAHLAEALKSQAPRIRSLEDGGYPLLVLETDQDVAGFALIQEKPHSAYREAYERFQNIYGSHRGEWSGKTLSFVICRASDDRRDDAFFKRIEGDVYFCKKFVIPVKEDPEALKAETARLPFVPLDPTRTLGVERVGPAKAFLIDHGVEPALSDVIVTAHKRSARRILDDSLHNVFRRDRLERQTAVPVRDQDSGTARSVRLKRLEITDFRAYKRCHSFDLDGDVVLLYGPNGLGKTSFFDAIDFLCTGRIGRLSNGHSDRSRFLRVASHLEAPPGSGSVSADFAVDGEDKSFRRLIRERNYVIHGSESMDRKGLLTILTGISPQAKRARVEYLQRLFRATHYFGQGYQELLQDFRNDSTLSEEVVARMLVVEDYVEASRKLASVCECAEDDTYDLKEERDSIVQQIGSIEERISELSNLLEEAAGQLVDISELTQRLSEQLEEWGVTIGGSKAVRLSCAEDAQRYRSLAKAEAESIREKLAELDVLQAHVGISIDRSTALGTLNEELKKLVEEIGEVREAEAEIRTRLEESQRRTLAARSERQEVEKELALRRWIERSKPEFDSLKAQKSSLTAEGAKLQANSSASDESIVQLNREVAKSKQVADTTRSRLNSVQNISNSIGELLGELDNWASREQDADQLREEARKLAKQLNTLETERRKLEREIEQAELRTAEARQRLEAEESETKELVRLLSDVESVVDSEECPVCGVKQESQDALILIIRGRKQFQSESAKQVADMYTSERQVLMSLKEHLRELDNELEAIKISQASNAKRLEEISTQLDDYSARAGSLGAVGKHVEVAERLHVLMREQGELQERLEREVKNADQAGVLLREKVEGEKAKRATIASAVETKYKELNETEDSLRELERSLRDLDISNMEELLDKAPRPTAELDAALAIMDKELAEAGLALAKLGDEYSNLASKGSWLEQRRSSAIEKRDQIVSDRTALIRRLHALGVEGDDLSLESVYKRADMLGQQLAEYERIELDLSKLGILLDESEKDSLRSLLTEELENLRQRLDTEVDPKLNGLGEWLAYFRQMKALVDRERTEAVRKYVDHLGPLSSTIQERLRPVYGFGRITLEAANGSILTHVSHGSEQVRPSDYFSDSQKQILMLSLFLSAAITQTWSTFGPILLDDPVTHFDDLNAYSLAELVRALVQQRAAGAQFMVSTCEERMYRLLRQKLAGSSDLSVIAYEFLSIGKDGPEYRRIADTPRLRVAG